LHIFKVTLPHTGSRLDHTHNMEDTTIHSNKLQPFMHRLKKT